MIKGRGELLKGERKEEMIWMGRGIERKGGRKK